MWIGLALSVGADGGTAAGTRVTGRPSPEILSFPVVNTPVLREREREWKKGEKGARPGWCVLARGGGGWSSFM